MSAIPSRILVPVDFTDTSRDAIDYAVQLAATLNRPAEVDARAVQTPSGCAIELLHVIEDPVASDGWTLELDFPDEQGIVNDLLQDSQQRLERLAAATPPGASTVSVKASVGQPSATIVETAAADGCDLIVMGTHGRTGLPHALLGSVAERVVRTARCPVVTIRHAVPHPEARSDPVLLSAVPS
jgi:nucleotide-binding universal stress UspA family protein